MIPSALRFSTLLGSAVATAAGVQAQTFLFWGDNQQDFDAPLSWTGGVAPADSLTAHIAVFNAAAPTNQPVLDASQRIAGLRFNSGAGAVNLTSTNGSVLTLGQAGVTHHGSATQTVGVDLVLGADSTLVSDGGGALRLDGALDLDGRTLSVFTEFENTTRVAGPVSSTSGGGAIAVTGPGVFTLAGANSYAGGTSVTGYFATLELAHAEAAGTGTVVFGDEARVRWAAGLGDISVANTFQVGELLGTLDTNGNDVTLTGSITGTSSTQFEKTGAGTLTVLGDIAVVGDGPLAGVLVNEGSLRLGNGGALGNVADDLVFAAGTSLIFDHSVDASFSRALSGDSGGAGLALIKTGSGTLTFSGALSTPFNTTIQQGRVIMSLSGVGGATLGGLSGAGALDVVGGSLGLNGNLDYSGALSLDSASVLNVSAGETGPQVLGGSITGDGGIKLDRGVVALGDISAFTGLIDFNGGGLRWAVGDTRDLSPLFVATNSGFARFQIDAPQVTLARRLVAARSITKSGSGTLSFTGGLSTQALADITVDEGWLEIGGTQAETIRGTLRGPGSLRYNGSGTLTVAGAVDVGFGTLDIAGGEAIFDFPNPTLFNGIADQVLYRVSGAGALVKRGAGILAVLGDLTYTGGTRVEAGTLRIGGLSQDWQNDAGSIQGDIELGNGTTLELYRRGTVFENNLSGEGDVFVRQMGVNQMRPLVITGTWSHTGATTMFISNVSIGDGGTMGWIPGDITIPGMPSRGLIFNRSDDVIYTGSILGAGQHEIVKLNANTLTWTGSIASFGEFLVEGGTLRFNGNTNGSILVNDGTRLDGEGSITFDVTVKSGGTVAAGDGAGLLTVGRDLVMETGGFMEMQIGGTARGADYDAFDIGGALTANGRLTVSWLNGYTAAPGASFRLFQVSSIGGTFAEVSLPALGGGATWDISELYSDGLLSVAAIPEPSTVGILLGLGAFGAVGARRGRATRGGTLD